MDNQSAMSFLVFLRWRDETGLYEYLQPGSFCIYLSVGLFASSVVDDALSVGAVSSTTVSVVSTVAVSVAVLVAVSVVLAGATLLMVLISPFAGMFCSDSYCALALS